MNGHDVFQFGAFTLALGERRLVAGGDTIRLSPKTFDVLATLVQHQGHLMTKHELLARVWPEVFVDDGILTVHVAALRKALGDDRRRPSYIETVSQSGYRFVAAVTCGSEDCPACRDCPRSDLRPSARRAGARSVHAGGAAFCVAGLPQFLPLCDVSGDSPTRRVDVT